MYFYTYSLIVYVFLRTDYCNELRMILLDKFYCPSNVLQNTNVLPKELDLKRKSCEIGKGQTSASSWVKWEKLIEVKNGVKSKCIKFEYFSKQANWFSYILLGKFIWVETATQMSIFPPVFVGLVKDNSVFCNVPRTA